MSDTFDVNKAFKAFLPPSLLSVAASQFAGIVDASLVGNIIGPSGLSGVVISRPVLQAIFALTMLYAASGAVMAGKAIGGGDRKKADSLMTFAVAGSIVLGLLFTIIGFLFIDPLSGMLCKSEELRPMATVYMKYMIAAAVPQMLMYTLHQYVTIDGSPKLVTIAVAIGSAVNVILDIVFMKVFGMGIAGAALATCIMYVLCCVLVLPHFFRKGSLRFATKGMLADINFRELFTFGVPLFFSTALISLQLALYNDITVKYMGENGMVALAVCLQLFSFSMIVRAGTMRTIQPIGAILCGKGDIAGIHTLMKKSYVFIAICLGIYAVCIALFPASIAKILGAASPEALPFVLSALPAFSLYIIMHSLINTLMPVYQLYGQHALSLFISIAETLMPVAGFYLMCRIAGNPWLGFAAGDLLVAAVVLIWCRISSRRHNLHPILLTPEL